MKLNDIKLSENSDEEVDDSFNGKVESIALSWQNGNKNDVHRQLVKMKSKEAIAVTAGVMRFLGKTRNEKFMDFLIFKI